MGKTFAIVAVILAGVALTYARQLPAPTAGDRVELAVDVSKAGARIGSVTGETLTASAVDSVNTFANPAVVEPRPVASTLRGDQVSLTLAPKSVTVLSVRQ